MKVKEKLSDWRYRLSKVWLFDRLETTYYRLKYGLFNFYLLGPVIWSFRTWDYAYFLNVMITMLEQMERHHRDYGACVDHHRTAKQIRTAKILCQRIRNGNYATLAGYDRYQFWRLSKRKRRHIIEHESYLAKQDLEYLGQVFKKHLRSWWD